MTKKDNPFMNMIYLILVGLLPGVLSVWYSTTHLGGH